MHSGYPFVRLGVAVVGLVTATCVVAAEGSADLRERVAAKVAADYPTLEALYRHFHANPELSLMEEKTAARMAAELRAAGFDVTEKFGGHGVVGLLANGAGPTLLIRADMDALPVQEETGLDYASNVRVRDLSGNEVPVMHACGHDVHLTSLLGAARTLAGLRAEWAGTLVLIAQPAEERGLGARAMLDAGLFWQFPRPDFAIALHTSATLPAGSFGTIEGFAMANVDLLDITVRGVGGHAAYPHTTKDPIVLASRIVVALQTIVSRETRPIDPAVVTVGSFIGGTKHNVIPNEVKLQLTLRTYSDAVRRQTMAAVRRICEGEAIAAGIPPDLMPIVMHSNQDTATPALYNDPALTRRVRSTLMTWFGADRMHTIDPEMGGEDFGRYGRTAEKVPICLFRLGVVPPEEIARSEREGKPLPSLHSSKFAPAAEPSLRAGATALSVISLELLEKS